MVFLIHIGSLRVTWYTVAPVNESISGPTDIILKGLIYCHLKALTDTHVHTHTHTQARNHLAQADSQFVWAGLDCLQWEHKSFWPGMRQLEKRGHEERGRSHQTFGWNATLRYSGSLSPRQREHFKVSEAEPSHAPALVLNDRYSFYYNRVC